MRLFFLLFFVFGCLANTSAKSEREQLKDYCHAYLRELSKLYGKKPAPGKNFQIQKIHRTNIIGHIIMYIGNAVTPPSSWFHSSSRCWFRIDAKKNNQIGSLDFVLLVSEAAAKHSAWDKLQNYTHKKNKN